MDANFRNFHVTVRYGMLVHVSKMVSGSAQNRVHHSYEQLVCDTAI